VSLYQFNIALGEVFGFVVAAIFVGVRGNWRYILGSSLIFSTILLVAMIFLPESPRYLMHKGKELEAYEVWKKIRGFNTLESKVEFLGMKHSVVTENTGTT
jgi:MFS family permease